MIEQSLTSPVCPILQHFPVPQNAQVPDLDPHGLQHDFL